MKTTTKATAAQKLLTAIGDISADAPFIPVSPKAKLSALCGTKTYGVFGVEGDDREAPDTLLVASLCPSDERVVEIQNLQVMTQHRGYGTFAMRNICRLADELEVSLWLDAYSSNEARKLKISEVPHAKLVAWYQRLGFFHIREPQDNWLSLYHRRYYRSFTCPMMRNPREDW